MQANESFRLVIRRGPQPNQTYDLNKDIVTLGRDITNDITINDPEVSRHHMRLTRGAGGFTVEDLGSTNGTFVNGQRLTGAKPLNNGDMIGLGETVTLGYEMVRAVGAVSAAPDVISTVPSPAARQPVSPQPAVGGPNSPQQQPYSPYSPAPSAPPPVASYTPAPPQAPPTPGYDYDPYAVREEEPRNATRWILIGCAGISLLCCCTTAVGIFLVDQFCLWDRLPIIWDILRALGYSATC